MLEISATATVGVATRYAAQIRELLVLRRNQVDRTSATSDGKPSADLSEYGTTRRGAGVDVRT